MVNYDPKYRLERVLDTVVPSIVVDLDDKKFQLEQLEKHEGIAKKLNAKCGYKIADITQVFDSARRQIIRQHKQVEKIAV